MGFIGLGVMGAPLARRLRAAGYPLIVHDRDPAAVRPFARAGAAVAPSPRAVADAAHVVCVSLPRPAVVEAVALGPDGIVHGRAARTFVDLSTTGAAVEREVAAALARRGIDTVDAPVSGGAEGAAAGTLAVMVAGPARAVARVRGLLGCFGTVFVVGSAPGQAQLLKVLNNLLSSTALAVTAEALVAGVKGGLDPERMLAAINAGSGRNSATADKFPKWVLPRTFAFGHSIDAVCKDAGLALDEAQALGVPMWVGSAAFSLWRYARANGGAALDMTALVTFVERWAGVEVRGRRRGARRRRGEKKPGRARAARGS